MTLQKQYNPYFSRLTLAVVLFVDDEFIDNCFQRSALPQFREASLESWKVGALLSHWYRAKIA